MVSVPTFDSLYDYLSGQGGNPLEQGQQPVQPPSPTISSGAPTGGQSSAPQTSAPQQASPDVQTGQVIQPPSAPMVDQQGRANTLGSTRSTLDRAQTSLGDLFSTFQQQAGPDRTFAGIGGQQTIDAGLQLGASQDAVQQGTNLVNAAYGGPTSLADVNQERAAELAADFDRIRSEAPTITTQQGIQDQLRQTTAGLTPGEIAFEARQKQQDEDYMSQASDLQERMRKAYGDYMARQNEAQQRAQQRAQQEQQIAQEAQNYINQQRRDTSQAIDQRVQQLEAVNEANRNLYDQFTDTGTLEDMRMLKDFATFDPDQFYNNQAIADEAQQQYQQFMADNPVVSQAMEQYGPEGLWITKRGRIGTTRPGAENQYDPTQGMDPGTYWNQYVPAMAKLQEMFDPGVFKEGKYSAFNPLYLAGEGMTWQPEDLSKYTVWDPGVSPTRENVSTDEQRALINQANEMLGLAERLEKAGDPFKAATVGADVERFLEDEARALEQVKGRQKKAVEQWKGMVHQARRNYRKAKKAAKWGSIANIGLGLVTGGLGGAAQSAAVNASIGDPIITGAEGSALTGSKAAADSGTNIDNPKEDEQ